VKTSPTEPHLAAGVPPDFKGEGQGAPRTQAPGAARALVVKMMESDASRPVSPDDPSATGLAVDVSKASEDFQDLSLDSPSQAKISKAGAGEAGQDAEGNIVWQTVQRASGVGVQLAANGWEKAKDYAPGVTERVEGIVGATVPVVESTVSMVVEATAPTVNRVVEATAPTVNATVNRVVEATAPTVNRVVEATAPTVNRVVEAATPVVESTITRAGEIAGATTTVVGGAVTTASEYLEASEPLRKSIASTLSHVGTEATKTAGVAAKATQEGASMALVAAGSATKVAYEAALKALRGNHLSVEDLEKYNGMLELLQERGATDLDVPVRPRA